LPQGKRILKSQHPRKVRLTERGTKAFRLDAPLRDSLRSWLNQVEIWLGILMRRVIKRGPFTSLDDLRAKILAFIDSFNRTAKPFRWIYAGRPLQM